MLLGLRCRAAEMALQAVSSLAAEGLLPTVSLVLHRACANARRQRFCLNLDSAKEGLGLLLQRGWLQEAIYSLSLKMDHVKVNVRINVMNVKRSLICTGGVPFLHVLPLLSGLSGRQTSFFMEMIHMV